MGVVNRNVFDDEIKVTFVVGNSHIKNVVIPNSEAIRLEYRIAASKIIKKCGIRPDIKYYPIPQKIVRRKKFTPYFLVCLASCLEEIQQREAIK